MKSNKFSAGFNRRVRLCPRYIQLYAYFLLAMLLGNNVLAASVISMNLEEMVEVSDTIVIGKCLSVNSRWKDNKIYTDVQIQVTESLMGKTEDEYIVTTLGGTAFHPKLNTSVTMTVTDGLSFRPDDEMLLFTKKNRIGQHQVVGMSQGKYNIKTDQKTGKKHIPVGLKTVYGEIVKASQTKRKQRSGTNEHVIKTREMELSEFIEKIHSYVKSKHSKNNATSQKNFNSTQ